MASTDKKPIKKPYHSPKLSVYGDVRALTETTTSGNPNTDGGYGGTLKTG